MKFKLFLSLALVAALLISIKSYSVAEDTAKDGLTIFKDSKCVTCHSITSQSIESKKKDPVDLSSAGADHDAAFYKKYLMKEETMHEKKHPIAFKGEAADFETLCNWLATLKPAETK